MSKWGYIKARESLDEIMRYQCKAQVSRGDGINSFCHSPARFFFMKKHYKYFDAYDWTEVSGYCPKHRGRGVEENSDEITREEYETHLDTIVSEELLEL